MSKTNDKILSISLLKSSIETIVANIKELKKVKSDNGDCGIHVDRLKNQTEELLLKVETAPIDRLTKVLKKRKLKRLRKKYKLKQMKAEASNRITSHDLKANRISIVSQNSEYPSNLSYSGDISSLKKDQHIRLLKHYDAQRFLRSFELLKILHYSRGQNGDNTKEFTEQLRNLGVYWSKILEEHKLEGTQEQHAEDQWDEIFFGSTEHSYYDNGKKISEFLRIRRIWDSYLTRSKHGSSTPCGWILPRENSRSEWQQYRVM